MRLKVNQIRIALIAVNLVLAGSAAAYAFSKYKDHMERKRESVKIIPANNLVPRDGQFTEVSRVGQLTMVEASLHPRKPAEIPDKEPGDEPPPPPPDETPGDDLDPGPLADHWEYAFFILLEDPMNNLVILRKKDASGAAGPASRQAGVRPRSTMRPSRVNLSQRKPAGGIQPAGDSLTFTVGQRWYKNDTVDPPVDIYIHSADKEKFVYWEPGKPEKMYALQRETHSFFYEDPEKGLRPPPKPEGEEEEAKPRSHFVLRPAGWEDKKEEEYQRMLKGEPAGPNIKLTGPQELEKKETETAEASAVSKKPVPSFKSSKAQEPRKTFTDEEKEQLRDVMRSPKMSEKDKADLRKALMGSGKKK